MEMQRESEEVVSSTYYETVCGVGSEEPYTLVDKQLGVIEPARLPYLLKKVRLNGRHLKYMLDQVQLMSLSDAESDEEDEPADVDLNSYVPAHPQ